MERNEERLSRALSASSRRTILRLLADHELTVKEIAQKTGQSMSLASRHLTLLYDLGILTVRKEFPYKYYSLRIPKLKKLISLYDEVMNEL